MREDPSHTHTNMGNFLCERETNPLEVHKAQPIYRDFTNPLAVRSSLCWPTYICVCEVFVGGEIWAKLCECIADCKAVRFVNASRLLGHNFVVFCQQLVLRAVRSLVVSSTMIALGLLGLFTRREECQGTNASEQASSL